MDRRLLSRVTRILWPFASLWLLLAAAAVLVSGLAIRADRSAALAAAREGTETHARAARVYFAETLDFHDHALALQKVVHERRLSPLPLGLPAEGQRATSALSRRVDQYDRDGRFVASNDPRAEPAPAIADRGWFDEARARNDLVVGRPVTGAVPGDSVIPLARRLEAPDGAFDGVLVAYLDPARLLDALSLLSTDHRMTLGFADRDGAVHAWTRAAEPVRLAGLGGAGTMPSSVEGAAQELVLAGRPTLVALATVPGRDLAVIAAVDVEAALAPHHRHARTVVFFAGLTIGAISIALAIVGRRALAERNRRRQLERRYEDARNRARTDPLTAVANRAAFDDQLRVAHAILAADDRPFVLAFIDIDRFKALNDRFGHATGDRTLRLVGKLLREGVRREDTVARLGGDEFAVLMPAGNALAMRRVFEPLRERLNELVANEKWPISFSIGVVAFESAPARAREAVNVADRVMYDVKSAGRDGVRYAIYRAGALRPDLEPAPVAA